MITDLLGSDQDQGSDPTSSVNMASPCSTSVHTETTLRSITTDPAEWKGGKFVINGAQRSGTKGEQERREKCDAGHGLVAKFVINGAQRSGTKGEQERATTEAEEWIEFMTPSKQKSETACSPVIDLGAAWTAAAEYDARPKDRQEESRSPVITESYVGVVCDKNPIKRHTSGYVTDMENSTIGASRPIFSESRRISFMVDPQRMADQEEKMDQLNQLVHQQRRWTEQIMKDLQNEQKLQQENLCERMSAQMQSLDCKLAEQIAQNSRTQEQNTERKLCEMLNHLTTFQERSMQNIKDLIQGVPSNYESRITDHKPAATSTPVKIIEPIDQAEELDELRSLKSDESNMADEIDPTQDQDSSMNLLAKSMATYFSQMAETKPGKNQRAYVKPPRYDGKRPFEPFLKQFESCARTNQWDKEMMLAQLTAALDGSAQQILWDSPSQTQTYTETIKVLQGRFGAEHQVDKHRLELKARRRKQDESLTDLHHEIRRLWTLAKNPTEGSDHLMIEAFLDAVNYPSLAHDVRRANPQSYDEALTAALRTEALYSETKRARELNQALKDKEGSKGRSQNIKGSEKEKSDRKNKQTSQKRTFHFKKSDHPESGASASPETSMAAMETMLSQLMSNMKPKNEQSSPRSPIVCYNCDQPGHMRAKCPKPLKSSWSPNKKATSGRGAGSQPSVTHVSEGPARTNKVAVKRSTHAYIDCEINGELEHCLLDTGSELTLFPAAKACKYNLQVHPTDQRVFAANESEMKVKGACIAPIVFAGYSIPTPAIVCPHVDEIILGLPWIEENRILWDAHEREIVYRGKRYALSHSNATPKCRRIKAASTHVIPPKHQAIIPVDLINNSPREIGEQYYCSEAKVLAPGVYSSHTLLKGDQYTGLAVRVLNITSRPVRITEGRDLGYLSPVQPPEQIAMDDSEAELIKLPDELTPKQHAQAVSFLAKYKDIMSTSDLDIGRTHLIEHEINTGDARPIRQPLRRHPIAHLEEIDRQTQDLLDHDLIEPAASPWASNVVLVTKRDGSARMCVDYRSVNFLTKFDAYPLPHLDTCLNAMKQASWFSTLDLRAGYHNIPIKEEHRDKTTFITRKGSWRYKVLPFGLSTAPGTFQRLMDMVLSGLTYEMCMVYLDDVIVFSETFEDHIDRLEQVFTRLKEAGLKLKPSKCHLFKRSVEFLGHIISGKGIQTATDKVEAVRSWPTPKNLTESRSFTGLCSYYRRFIKDFSKIASPLYALTKKNAVFHWGDEQQQAFEELKSKLISAPILGIPRDDGMYILDTDASDKGLGVVLSQIQDQQERVIAYSSRVLNAAETNYSVTRRELLAIIYGLRQYKQFLLGRKFLIRTDHAALQYLRRTPELIGQEARWLNFIESFQFDIKHRPGISHANADALSRKPAENHNSENTNTETEPTLCRKIAKIEPCITLLAGEKLGELQEQDPVWGKLAKLLRSGEPLPKIDQVQIEHPDFKTLLAQKDQLIVHDGVIYRQFYREDHPMELQILLPKSLRVPVIQELHANVAAHAGIRKTLDHVQRRAYWPRWISDVKRVLKSCERCQEFHRGKLPRHGDLHPILAGAPLERMSIDLTGPHHKTPRRAEYILTCVDVFTKWAEAFPIPSKEAHVVARVLVDNVFTRIGTPISLLSDRGTDVDSTIMREVCQLLHIDKLRTTAYKPSTNAACERFHRTLNKMIGKLVSERQDDWDLILPHIMSCYRATVHDTHGYTPNMLMLGREVRAPVDIALAKPLDDDPISFDAYVDNLQDRLEIAYDRTRKELQRCAEINKRKYDMRVKPSEFKAGDHVYLFKTKRRRGIQEKWARKYEGPYIVLKHMGPVNLLVAKSPRSTPFCVHVDKVKPYQTLDSEDLDSENLLRSESTSWDNSTARSLANESVNNAHEVACDRTLDFDCDQMVDDIQINYALNSENNEPYVGTLVTDQDLFRKSRPTRNIKRPGWLSEDTYALF
jgi:hypothetical protein